MNGPDGRRFPWGPITAVHTIGDISIVEFTWKAIANSDREGKTHFAVFLGGKDVHTGRDSLDSAVVHAIAIKRDGLNTQASMYFDRMTLASSAVSSTAPASLRLLSDFERVGVLSNDDARALIREVMRLRRLSVAELVDVAVGRRPAAAVSGEQATPPSEEREPCEHCPDGHPDPNTRRWAVWVTAHRDSDGQPTHMTISTTNGAHCSESDAQWVREALNPHLRPVSGVGGLSAEGGEPQ